MFELRIETRKVNENEGIAIFISQPILIPKVHNIILKDRIVPLNNDSEGASQEISALNQALCELSDLAINGIINKDIIPEFKIIRKDDSLEFSKVSLESIQKLREKGIDVEY